MWQYQLLWPADLGKGGDISKMMTVFRQNPEMEPVDENISYSNVAVLQAEKCQSKHSNLATSTHLQALGFIKTYF